MEGSPKELKGNPGPEVESFLQVHTTQAGDSYNLLNLIIDYFQLAVIMSKQSNHCDLMTKDRDNPGSNQESKKIIVADL